jgi:hypothetical protein
MILYIKKDAIVIRERIKYMEDFEIRKLEILKNKGRIFRHFKGKYYLLIDFAIHTETRETLVIYKALYGDCGIYARPLDMFISEVDNEKYPEVKEKWRFNLVEN